ncbi:MAG TPA: biotin/lipoyl-containing protein, partial [Solirubrobacteraceae bacterium]|nr:biotin/lipoyl-containing protein [Solirubrobacteraceae bacterium]
MADVVMPRLSDSMEEGTIVRWLVEDGQEVSRGDELVEIETDKATMTYEADEAGPVRIVAAEGDTLPIGAVIASIGAAGAGAPAPAATGVPAESEPAGAAPAAAGAAPAGADAPPAAPSGNGGGTRVKASPVARRLARERGVELGALRGSGPGGRIVKADVEAAAGAAAPAAPQPAAPQPAAPPEPAAAPPEPAAGVEAAKGRVSVVELSRTQALIARRMAESKATIPAFTLSASIDMTEAVALRAELKALAGPDGTPPSYNDMVVRACALALREHPRANGSYRDG